MNKISDFNGPKSNDTFELTTINGIPIFVSAEWREASDGSQSIADWVYETNKPVSPICYFKTLSRICIMTYNFGLIGMRLHRDVCSRILKGNQLYCLLPECYNTNNIVYSNHSASSIRST